MQDIERIHFLRDDQIPRVMSFRAIQQRFRLEDVRCGIVEVEGPNLVILDRQKKFYLICRHDSKVILQQIRDLLSEVSISICMEIPLRETESILGEEDFAADESDLDLLESLEKPETEKHKVKRTNTQSWRLSQINSGSRHFL